MRHRPGCKKPASNQEISPVFQRTSRTCWRGCLRLRFTSATRTTTCWSSSPCCRIDRSPILVFYAGAIGLAERLSSVPHLNWLPSASSARLAGCGSVAQVRGDILQDNFPTSDCVLLITQGCVATSQSQRSPEFLLRMLLLVEDER